jgi:hypothetical protein
MLIVKREKAKELLDYLDKNFPEIKIAYKDEPYKNCTMKLIMVYVFIINLFIMPGTLTIEDYTEFEELVDTQNSVIYKQHSKSRLSSEDIK